MLHASNDAQCESELQAHSNSLPYRKLGQTSRAKTFGRLVLLTWDGQQPHARAPSAAGARAQECSI